MLRGLDSSAFVIHAALAIETWTINWRVVCIAWASEDRDEPICYLSDGQVVGLNQKQGPTMRIVIVGITMLMLACASPQAEAEAPDSQASKPETRSSAASKDDDSHAATKGTDVQLGLVHGVALPSGNPGFQLNVRGWQADAEISFFLVGPQGEQITVASPDDHLKASASGGATFSVPYELDGLSPGNWVGVVAGPPGIHKFMIEIPTIERK
ncbi:MAG TPA: hypothetical protein VHO25_14240 [Polyangiaceae bacterium]|nr:hypothetical protein [Polyangiaceae bacterium]